MHEIDRRVCRARSRSASTRRAWPRLRRRLPARHRPARIVVWPRDLRRSPRPRAVRRRRRADARAQARRHVRRLRPPRRHQARRPRRGGLYHEGTRYLSLPAPRARGRRPFFLSSTVRDENDQLATPHQPGPRARRRSSACRSAPSTSRFRSSSGATSATSGSAVTNYADATLNIEARAPLRGRLRRHLRGPRHAAHARGEDLAPTVARRHASVLGYAGSTASSAGRSLAFSAGPMHASTTASATLRLSLEPRRERSIGSRVACVL